MASSKSSRRSNTLLFSRHTAAVSSEPVAATVVAGAVAVEPIDSEPEPVAVMSKRNSLLVGKSTRLQRLSAYLPHINTSSESKRSQAPPLPPRKAQPERLRRPSESYSPPLLPPLPSSAPADLTEYSSKLQTTAPPFRTPPELPGDANGLSPRHHGRTPSPSLLTKVQPYSPNSSPLVSPYIRARGRGDSLVAPPAFNDVSGGSTASTPVVSEGGNKPLRRSWLPGGKSRNASQDISTETQTPPAWITAGEHKIDYGLSLLIQGGKVSESNHPLRHS